MLNCCSLIRATVGTAVLALATGCTNGRSVGLIDVQGDVVFDGKPIASGNISFLRADESNSFSGFIKDGRYSIGNSETGIGVPPGEYLVAFSIWEIPPGMGKGGEGKELVPRRYFNAKTSGFKVLVSKEQKEIDFELQR